DTPEAIRRSLDVHEVSSDAVLLQMLAPDAKERIEKQNAEALEFSDRALARGACRFDSPLLTRWSTCYRLRRLHFARGHAALATGSTVASAEHVRRLLRFGRDFAATPPHDEDEAVGVWPELHVLYAEQEASQLLAALATAPVLPPEAAPALLAAARDAWDTPEAIRRSLDVHEVSSDAVLLQMLAPDAKERIEKQNAELAELEELMSSTSANQGFLDKAKDRIQRALRPRPEVPTAAEIREFRAMRAPIVAAHRRRDTVALAPGGPHEKTGPLFGFLGPRWFRTTVVYEARIALARAAAAIRAFQLREGRPPRSFEELVPSMLPEVPLDPFDGKPLLYEVEGDAWRVASRVWRERAMGEDETEAASHPVEVRFPRAPK
ncbi:MAG TPA: hypothetical protein VFS92_02270, partial [Planctomycetota bacterium]|nr:hypothetical protein [Planctomycetota bacterium]